MEESKEIISSNNNKSKFSTYENKDKVIEAIIVEPESSSDVINYYKIKNELDLQREKMHLQHDIEQKQMKHQRDHRKVLEEIELHNLHNERLRKDLIVRFGLIFSPLLTILGTGAIISNASVIAGVGLIGFGVAVAGSIFAIASGNKVTVSEFSKAAYFNNSKIISDKSKDATEEKND